MANTKESALPDYTGELPKTAKLRWSAAGNYSVDAKKSARLLGLPETVYVSSGSTTIGTADATKTFVISSTGSVTIASAVAAVVDWWVEIENQKGSTFAFPTVGSLSASYEFTGTPTGILTNGSARVIVRDTTGGTTPNQVRWKGDMV